MEEEGGLTATTQGLHFCVSDAFAQGAEGKLR